jgi:AraC-like DNA-binding protein
VVSRAPLKEFQTAFDFYDVDGLVFNRVRYSAADFKRTPTHLRGGEGDMIVMHMLLSGSERGEVDGKPLRMNPHRVIVQDWAHPYLSSADESEQISVAIPRDRLAARDLLYEKRPVVEWLNESPQGMIVGHSMRGIRESLPHTTKADAPAIAAGFPGLLNRLLDPRGDCAVASVPGAGSTPAMKDYLVRRLHRPRLGIDDLTGAFHCSRSTVYRLFKEDGGVRRFVADQRMNEAFRILTRPEGSSERITDIASQLGFADVYYFHRAFKRRFGITAGEAKELGSGLESRTHPDRQPDGDRLELSKLHRWLGARD